MNIPTVRNPLLLLAVGVPLILGGCATRDSVRQAQAAADAADTHAADARTRADAAQARADEAAGIGNNALSTAHTSEQKAEQLEADLKTANAKISYLQRNVVYKHIKHVRHKKRRVVHHTTPPANNPTSTTHSGT